MAIRIRISVLLALVLVASCLAVAAGNAAEVRFVGTITDGPLAPTALDLHDAGLAALEPYHRALNLYSPDGTLSLSCDIEGEPRGLARLGPGIYLFCEPATGTVHRVDMTTGQQAKFLTGMGEPVDLAVAGEEVYVLDGRNRRIVVADLAGTTRRTLLLPVPEGEEGGWLADLAYDAIEDRFHVLDQSYSTIHCYDADGGVVGSFCGFGTDDGEISRGGDLVCDDEGWIYVADRFQGRVAIFRPDGSFVTFVDPLDLDGPALATPTGLAVDGSGMLYVASTESGTIHIYHVDKTAAAPGALLAQAQDPRPGDTMPANELLFVARIQAPLALADEIVADLRLYDAADMTGPLAEATGLPLEAATALEDIVIGSVSWRPDLVLEEGRTYGWQVRARTTTAQGDWSAMVTFAPTAVRLPFRLDQNVPNPFNPMTVIHFNLATGDWAELSVYDIRGRRVWRSDLTGFGPGRHQVVWEGRDQDGQGLPSGIYFYRLTSGRETATRKMVLAR